MALPRWRIACAAAALALAAFQPAVAAQELAPDAVADLYFKAMLNRNAQAAKTLNAYVKPVIKDKGDMVDMTEFESYEAFQAKEVETLLQSMPADTPAGVREAMRDMYKGIALSYSNTQCVSKTRQIADNEHSPGGKIATVDYTCKIPKPSAGLKTRFASVFKRMGEMQGKSDVTSAQALQLADELKTTMRDYVQEMQSPKEVDVHSGTAQLDWEKETRVWMSVFDLPLAMKPLVEKIVASIPFPQIGE